MTARLYDDCELVIQSSGERYVVQITNIHAGEARGEFTLPFTQVELSNFYSRIGQAHRATRRADSPDVEAAKRFGDQLFRCIFCGELLSQLRASVDHAHERGHGLRLRLRLKNVPDLGELPWEFLYDSEQDHFLATSTLTPMVRYLDLPQNVTTLRVRAPLRILVVLAGPRNLPLLDAEGEWERLKKSLGPLETSGAVVLERLPDGSLASLRRRARGEAFHILHFVGHGGFDEVAGDGVLHFESTTSLSDPIPGQMLGNILRDHDTLRLVVLNACEGARQSNQNPFSGVAQSLCQQRLPAVIAMQFEISDDAAKTFAEEFYGAIADGLPVDAAVSESRKALYSGRFGQEWATPVLYMRSPSGALFDIQRKPRPAAPSEAAKPVQQAAAPVQEPAHQQPMPPLKPSAPPPPPPRPAFDIEAERRKLEEEKRRLEAERHQREQTAAEAEARRRAEEQRLKDERARFEQEQANARAAAEAQRLKEEQERRQRAELERRQREEAAKREEAARKEAKLRRDREELQRHEQMARQELAKAEEAKRLAEQARLQRDRAEQLREAAPAATPPPPAVVQVPVAFAGTVALKKSHRVRNVILWILGAIVLLFVILMIIGLIAEKNETKPGDGNNTGESSASENHLEMGDRAMAGWNFDQAIKEYTASVENHPKMAVAHTRLCNAIAMKGESTDIHKFNFDKAVEECNRAVEIAPNNAEVQSNLCNALVDKEASTLDMKGDYNAAIQHCQKATTLDPNYAEGFNNLCNAVGFRSEQKIARPGDYQRAVDACSTAVRLKPDFPEAYKNLGDLYRDSGYAAQEHNKTADATTNFNNAAAEYRRALTLRPAYWAAQLSLGTMLYNTGNVAGAIAEFKKAISLNPENSVAYGWLGSAYAATKDYPQAITNQRRAIELDRDCAGCEFSLSQAYRAQGNTSEANQHLTNAYALDSSDKGIEAEYKRYIKSGQ